MASKFARQLLNYRTYATVQGPSASAGDHGGGARVWKMLSLLVALPTVGLCYVNMQIKEKEHHDHFQRPEFIPYDHLRKLDKPYFWGDGNHTLFHNKLVNPLRDGYED